MDNKNNAISIQGKNDSRVVLNYTDNVLAIRIERIASKKEYEESKNLYNFHEELPDGNIKFGNEILISDTTFAKIAAFTILSSNGESLDNIIDKFNNLESIEIACAINRIEETNEK